jgi:hypothetical protein
MPKNIQHVAVADVTSSPPWSCRHSRTASAPCRHGALLSGITDSRLHTSVCNESHDDELMDAVLLQLQILCWRSHWNPSAPGPQSHPIEVRTHGGSRRPTCRFRRSFATTLLFGWVQCISRSRSRLAAHRTREVQPSAQHSGLATYEEHNDLPLQQSSSDPIVCLHRK